MMETAAVKTAVETVYEGDEAHSAPDIAEAPLPRSAAADEAPRRKQGMAESEKKQLTLRVPADVHQKMRILAAIHGKSMTEYFIQLIEEEYEKQHEQKGPVQLKLPT